MSIAEPSSHSIHIDARLEVEGRVLRVGQVFGHCLVLHDRFDATEPTEAELIITVRGQEKRYHVFFPHGIDSRSEVVSFL